jgi:hypothetical protein
MHPDQFRMQLRCFLAMAILVSTPLRGQAPPRVDLAVETVVTGGSWTAGRASGTYRAIGYSSGSEEVRHHVQLEWIDERGVHEADTVRTTINLNELASTYGLTDPKFAKRGGRWILTVRASRRPLSHYDRAITFELGLPGKVRRL